MLALAEYRATRCPNCGKDIRECTDPESDGKWHVPPPTRCYAATALQSASAEYTEVPQAGALLFHAERR